MNNSDTSRSNVKGIAAKVGGVVVLIKLLIGGIAHTAPKAESHALPVAENAIAESPLARNLEKGALSKVDELPGVGGLKRTIEETVGGASSAGDNHLPGGFPKHVDPLSVPGTPIPLGSRLNDEILKGAQGKAKIAGWPVTGNINKLIEEFTSQNNVIAFLREHVAGLKGGLHQEFPDEEITQYLLPYQVSMAPANEYKILSIIPDTPIAYERLFGTEMSRTKRQEMEECRALFKGLDNSTVASSVDYGSQDLFKYITANAKTNPLIIVGHSEAAGAGRILILPNGQRVSAESIHKACNAAHSRCLIVTCYGTDLGLTNPIDLKDAYYMTRGGVNMLALLCHSREQLPSYITHGLAHGSITANEVMVAAMRSEMIIRKARRVAISGVLVGAVGGGGKLVVSRLRTN